MTKRDFFILFIKLFSLSGIVGVLFSVVPGTLIYSINDFDLKSILLILFTILVIGLLFLLLLKKSGYIVDKLKLANGFDDDRINLGNLESKDIIRIATIVIGGFLIIENIPGLLNNSYWAFKREASVTELFINDTTYYNLTVNCMNIIVGYLLLSNYNQLATKLINHKESEP